MSKNKHHKTRTYNYNRILSRRGNEIILEKDSIFFLKLVAVVFASSLWVKFSEPIFIGTLQARAFPAGSILAIIFILLFERWQFNRKIWYTVLVMVSIVTYFLPAGIVI